MADITEAIRRMIFKFVTEGADDVIKAQEKIADTTTTTGKAALSLEKSFGSLERRYVDTVRHQQDYQKVQEKVNAAVAQNPALQERANVVLAAASEHFDKLAANANKGGIATSFMAKTISTIIGPAGLLGVAITAVGAAVAYMASQFESSSTTIEQALEEQNRLMKEAKNLIDAKASAEAKAFAQSPSLTEFQMKQNLIDLEIKLQKAMEETAEVAKRKVTTPTQVAGEMGEAPTAIAALGPIYDQIAAARERLNAAMAAGQPGLATFQEELSKIALAHPEMAKTVEGLIKVAQAGIGVEQGNLKLKAMQDALKGVATDAQLAAVGLGSVAQQELAVREAAEGAEKKERAAQFVLQMADAYQKMYPHVQNMTIETAKQLFQLDQQLLVARARTGAEQLSAQYEADINMALLQGVKLEEAKLIASKKYEIAQANIDKGIWKQVDALQEQIDLLDGMSKAQAAYNRAVDAGASGSAAAAIKAKTEELDLIQRRRQANQEYQQAINEQNAYLIQQQAIYNEIVETISFAAARSVSFDPASGRIDVTSFGNAQSWSRSSGTDTQFNPAGYQVGGTMDIGASLAANQSGGFDLEGYKLQQAQAAKEWEAIYGPGGFDTTGRSSEWKPNAQGLAFALSEAINDIISRSGTLAEAFSVALASGVTGNQLTQQLIDLAPENQRQSMIAAAIEAVSRQPATLAREQLLKQLTDKMEGLTSSTDALNTTMQSALSPYYSQDPRTTKLGFRAGVVGNPDWLTGATNATALDAILGAGATAPGMAGGGSFIVGGGYSATDNKIAQFPVASGEQVVVNRTRGGQATVVHNDNRIIVNGNLDQDTLSKLKVSRFQQAQRMRSASAA